MEEFAIELFVPRREGDTVAAQADRLAALAANLREEGTKVRYLRTLHLPQDETCFFVFEADSLTSMRRLKARARLAHARLASASSIEHQPTSEGSQR